ncbi:MAG: VOC family protein [Methylobacteriaceae bacterium]|nr:VOC family protein [Methylobacteriaceae bacterium]
MTFKTTRLHEMIDWYSKVVGVDVNFRFPGGAFTSNDRANHRIAFLAAPGLNDDAEKVGHAGLHHTAFEYESFDDLMSSYARLKGLGIEPDVCFNHGVTTSLYYADPDGNLVELQVDDFADWDRSSEWMRAARQFAADPIGVFFDADLVLAAHEDGVPFDQTREHSYAGKYPPKSTPNLHLPQ